MRHERTLSRLLCAASLAFSAAAMCQTPGAALDTKPANIRFGYITGIAFPTYIVAEDRGYFKGENLSIEKVFLNGSGAVSEALAAANLDMGNSAPASTVLATSKGGRTIAVSGNETTFTDKSGKTWEAVYVVVRSGEGIRNLNDLRGKRVAVNDYGSVYNYLLRWRFQAAGFNPDSDLTILAMPFAQMAGALVQKQVDAIVAVADGYAQAKQRIPVDVIGSHTSLEGLDVGLSSVIAVSNEFLRNNPDVVVRFLRAMLKARLYMAEAVANNDMQLMDIIAKNMKYNPERAKFFWETRGGYYGKELEYVNLLDIPKRLVARQFEVLKSINLLKADVPTTYENVVDIRPLRRAYVTLGLKWDESKH